MTITLSGSPQKRLVGAFEGHCKCNAEARRLKIRLASRRIWRLLNFRAVSFFRYELYYMNRLI